MVLPGRNALMYCVRVIPFCIVRTVILPARNSSVLRRTTIRLSANNARRKSRCQQTAGGGEGGGQEGHGTHLLSLPLALPRLPPKGHMRLFAQTVCDEMTFFKAAQRQTSGLTACADPFTQVCNAAERRPAVAKYRDTARQAAAKTERP